MTHHERIFQLHQRLYKPETYGLDGDYKDVDVDAYWHFLHLDTNELLERIRDFHHNAEAGNADDIIKQHRGLITLFTFRNWWIGQYKNTQDLPLEWLKTCGYKNVAFPLPTLDDLLRITIDRIESRLRTDTWINDFHKFTAEHDFTTSIGLQWFALALFIEFYLASKRLKA